jgi:hypothetical protein
VAFTGRLGTADSQLGQFELGSAGTAATPTQTLQLRANIRAVETQSIQLRANIRAVQTQSLDMRAHIRGTRTLDMLARIVAGPQQTLQMLANILGVSTQSLQMRANILGLQRDIQMRANIRAVSDLTMRARILQTVSADLDVTFDALQALDQWLLVTYDVGDKEATYRAVQMRAQILQSVTADLTVRFEVDYDGMPTDCISRPKTRVYLKTVRQFSMRARIIH